MTFSIKEESPLKGKNVGSFMVGADWGGVIFKDLSSPLSKNLSIWIDFLMFTHFKDAGNSVFDWYLIANLMYYIWKIPTENWREMYIIKVCRWEGDHEIGRVLNYLLNFQGAAWTLSNKVGSGRLVAPTIGRPTFRRTPLYRPLAHFSNRTCCLKQRRQNDGLRNGRRLNGRRRIRNHDRWKCQT